jgi:hypothetical protein
MSSGATKAIAKPYMLSLEKELADLLKQNIIEPIQGATHWLHPIVVVLKKFTISFKTSSGLDPVLEY